MYGRIGKLVATPGKRDELAALLIGATKNIPGCLSYVVALDSGNADALWVTEVWDSSASHKASLTLPSVLVAIGVGRPLIADFESAVETTPLGGVGLSHSS